MKGDHATQNHYQQIFPGRARTYSSLAAFTVMNSSRWLPSGDSLDPSAHPLLRGQLTLVPVVNEPAFLRGHRTGDDDGLDLARTCPGEPELVPTTEQIAHELSELIRQADYYIDLHTGGTTLQVLPLAGYGLHPDQDILDRQRSMARAFNLPIIWGTDGRLPGRSLSVARDCERSSYLYRVPRWCPK